MKIDVDELTAFLPVFVPALVTATLASCEAAVLQRELTSDEIDEITDKVNGAVIDYVGSMRRRLADKGETISASECEALAGEIQAEIFINAWALIQRVTEEIKSRVIYENL